MTLILIVILAALVFTYINGFYQPFPGVNANRLVRVYGVGEEDPNQSIAYLDYLDYAAARAQDETTFRRIEQLDARIDQDDACGATPLRGLLLAAKRRGMTVTTLDLCNSGDTGGNRDFVVGYGAWSFTEPRSAA